MRVASTAHEDFIEWTKQYRARRVDYEDIAQLSTQYHRTKYMQIWELHTNVENIVEL